MFLPNDVIQYVEPVRTIRILWIAPDRALAVTFELGLQHSQPRMVALQALADDVLAGRARQLPDDPFAPPAPAAPLPRRQRDVQAKAWDVIRSLQAQVPVLYQPRERAALVEACARAHGVSRQSVLRCLRRFWERGQTRDALLPDAAMPPRAARVGTRRPRRDAAPVQPAP